MAHFIMELKYTNNPGQYHYVTVNADGEMVLTPYSQLTDEAFYKENSQFRNDILQDRYEDLISTFLRERNASFVWVHMVRIDDASPSISGRAEIYRSWKVTYSEQLGRTIWKTTVN